ncbi:hypothetical protein GCM10009564_27430 [Streptomyces thermogriseus]|uniref:Uncharacterized protein n=1 Tax=Streptomyces thermogriseus TaxID=75292 RepID=A0ABN1T056_9ACTN
MVRSWVVRLTQHGVPGAHRVGARPSGPAGSGALVMSVHLSACAGGRIDSAFPEGVPEGLPGGGVPSAGGPVRDVLPVFP